MNCLVLLYFLFAQTQFEELSLEELLKVNVLALKIPAEIKKVPADVIIINEDEIKRLGFRNLASLISFMAGFYLLSDHSFFDISLRGVQSGIRSYTRTVKVLLNGVPVDFKFDGSNFIGDEFIPMECIKRIEIVKGPASSLYGKDALLGVINIVTKEENKGLKFKISKNFRGSDFYYVKDKFEYIVSYFSFKKEKLKVPEFSPFYNDFRDKEASSDFSNSFLFYQRFNKNINWFNLKSNALLQKITAPLLFSDYSKMEKDSKISFVNGKFTLGLEKTLNNLNLKSDFLYSFGFPLQDERIEVGNNSFYRQREFSYDLYESNLEISYSFKNSFLLLGFDYTIENHNLIDVYSVGKETGDKILDRRFKPSPQGDTIISDYAVYSQIFQKLFAEKLFLSLSLRRDVHSIFGGFSSYRAGLSFLPIYNVYLKFDFGSSYRAPGVSFLFSRPIKYIEGIVPNPALKLEKAEIYEFVLGFTRKNSFISFSFFYQRIFDKVEFVPKGVNLEPKNLKNAEGFGYEIRAKTEFYKFTSYLGFYTSFMKFEEDTLYMPLFPNYMFYFYLKRNFSFLETGIRMRWISEVRSSLYNERLNVFTPYYLPSYFLTDLVVRFFKFTFVIPIFDSWFCKLLIFNNF